MSMERCRCSLSVARSCFELGGDDRSFQLPVYGHPVSSADWAPKCAHELSAIKATMSTSLISVPTAAISASPSIGTPVTPAITTVARPLAKKPLCPIAARVYGVRAAA